MKAVNLLQAVLVLKTAGETDIGRVQYHATEIATVPLNSANATPGWS